MKGFPSNEGKLDICKKYVKPVSKGCSGETLCKAVIENKLLPNCPNTKVKCL